MCTTVYGLLYNITNAVYNQLMQSLLLAIFVNLATSAICLTVAPTIVFISERYPPISLLLASFFALTHTFSSGQVVRFEKSAHFNFALISFFHKRRDYGHNSRHTFYTSMISTTTPC